MALGRNIVRVSHSRCWHPSNLASISLQVESSKCKRALIINPLGNRQWLFTVQRKRTHGLQYETFLIRSQQSHWGHLGMGRPKKGLQTETGTVPYAIYLGSCFFSALSFPCLSCLSKKFQSHTAFFLISARDLFCFTLNKRLLNT